MHSRCYYEEDPIGWQEIPFDERLEGWTEYHWPPGGAPLGAEETGAWSVDADSGVLRTPGVPHTHLLYHQPYADFVLHVEWRYVPGEGSFNSGVFVRMVPGESVMHQIETNSGDDRVGLIMGGRLREGTLAPICAMEPDGREGWRKAANHTPNKWVPDVHRVEPASPPQTDKLGPSSPVLVHPPGEWNRYEILCVGSSITVRTNGFISSFTDRCTVPEGLIGFEAEYHPAEFRHLRIKEIRV